MAQEVVAVRVKLREGAIDNLIRRPTPRPGTVGGHLFKVGSRIERAAKRQVGVRSGRLRKSIYVRQGRRFLEQYVEVGTRGVPYALMHHNGTRPHIIQPDRQQMLSFTSKGRVVYTTRVVHPGTKPNRFLTDNLWLART